MADVNAASARKKTPPRAAYALPTLFTAGNIFLGYLCILRTIQGALIYNSNPTLAAADFDVAAKTIGFSFILDGLDGRIARMTNTTSEFGKELDSLADIISFGIAPAILAYVWGVQFAPADWGHVGLDQIQRIGKFVSFLFLVCGAARLARFNITKNPIPRNPGRPDRKYFVGLPIPAAAGLVAAVVHASDNYPITNIWLSSAWMALLAGLAFLMVCTWRYWSFKELNLHRPRSPLILVLICAAIYAVWDRSQPVLLIAAGSYVASGVITRIAGAIRRRIAPKKPAAVPEIQLG